MSFAALVLAPVCEVCTSEKVKTAARTEGLVLQQIVANAAKVAAELQRVVADDLGPVVDKVDVRLAPDPRHGCRIPNDRAGKAAVEGHADLSAGEWLSSDVHARDTQSGCIVRAVVVRLSHCCAGERRQLALQSIMSGKRRGRSSRPCCRTSGFRSLENRRPQVRQKTIRKPAPERY